MARSIADCSGYRLDHDGTNRLTAPEGPQPVDSGHSIQIGERRLWGGKRTINLGIEVLALHVGKTGEMVAKRQF